MSHQKFIRDVGIMGFTQILISLGGFLLLPILTKSLGSYDYGTWAQINVTISLITPLSLMGLSMGFVRFLAAEKDNTVVIEGFYSILFFVGFTGFLLSSIVYLSADYIAYWVFSDATTSYLIKISSLLILLNVLDQILVFYFRVFQKIKLFSLLLLFQTFGKIFFIGILLHYGYGLFGAIIGLLIEQIILLIITILIIISEIGFSFPKFIFIKNYLQFSVPMAPNGIIKWVTDSSDRYLIGYFLGLNSVGIYSAPYAIGSLILLFMKPLQQILFPEVTKLYDLGEYEKVQLYISYSIKYYLLITIPAVFGLSFLAKPIIQIVATSEFLSGWTIIPLIAISGLFGGVFQILINIPLLVKKTRFNLQIHFIAASSNIILNLLLIPHLGIIGAAISTLFSYSFMVIECYIISSKYLPIQIDYYTIIKSIISSLLMGLFILFYSPTSLKELVFTIFTCILLYIISMCLIKGLNSEELGFIRKMIKRN